MQKGLSLRAEAFFSYHSISGKEIEMRLENACFKRMIAVFIIG
jgi:hypothetical protein